MAYSPTAWRPGRHWPPGATPSDTQPGGHRLLQPVELGDALRSVVEEYRHGRGVGAAAGRFSLAGAQPKLALFRTENGAWAVPDGGTPTTHILKPVAGGYRRLDVTEFLTMRAAGHLGLDVAETQLVNFDGQPCFVTQRYDGEFSGDTWHRLHQEDLCQALAVPPDKKYQRQDGGPGVAECARLLNQLPNPADRSKTAMAFFQWLAFNVVCEGTDAHAKNFSLLLQGHRVSPAPLYDLLTYAPYRGDGETTYSAMKVGGEYRFSAISDKALVATARTLRLDPGWAESTLRAIQAGPSVPSSKHGRNSWRTTPGPSTLRTTSSPRYARSGLPDDSRERPPLISWAPVSRAVPFFTPLDGDRRRIGAAAATAGHS